MWRAPHHLWLSSAKIIPEKTLTLLPVFFISLLPPSSASSSSISFSLQAVSHLFPFLPPWSILFPLVNNPFLLHFNAVSIYQSIASFPFYANNLNKYPQFLTFIFIIISHNLSLTPTIIAGDLSYLPNRMTFCQSVSLIFLERIWY